MRQAGIIPTRLRISRPAAEATGWVLVAMVIAFQFLLFRRFLLREVVWAYPPNRDQIAYLQQAYELYERIRAEGIRAAMAHQPLTPQGAMMQLQAAILFRVTGPSRFYALMLNFAYFAAFQLALVGTVKWMSGRWRVALMALGLLLAARAPFHAAGGLSDFRMDFIAFCLYGTFICGVMRSGIFLDVRWSILAGLTGAALVYVRFLTAANLGVIFLMIFLTTVVTWGIAKSQAVRHRAGRRLLGAAVAGILIATVAGPAVWNRREEIRHYYVARHLTGPEKDIRAASTGTTHPWAALQYYPTNLWDQTGPAFALLALGLTAILALLMWGGRTGAPGNSAAVKTSPIQLPIAWGFAGVCVVVPLVLLTLDVSKSPVVGSILVPPVLWLIVLTIVFLSRKNPLPKFPFVMSLLAAGAISMALITERKTYARDRFMSRHRKDVDNVMRLYDSLLDTARARNMRTVALFNGQISDHLNAEMARLLSYERHGYSLDIGDQFSSLLEVPPAELMQALDVCDFALVSHKTGPLFGYDYPYNLELQRMNAQLMTKCRQTMDELDHTHIFDDDVTLFVRKSHAISPPALDKMGAD